MSATRHEPQTVLLTGAAQGLGAAIARDLAEAGARLLLIDRDAEGLEAVARDCGADVRFAVADLSDAESTLRALREFGNAVGETDTLIHNAAILNPVAFERETLEGFRRTLDVGLQAAFLLTQAVWPGMARRGGGMLVYVSSRSGIMGFGDEAAYCAAKHGLEGFSKSMAEAGAPHGIASVTITPGMPMHTPMSERNYAPEMKERWVEPARLAPAFRHLSAERPQALSGQRLDAWALSQELAGAT